MSSDSSDLISYLKEIVELPSISAEKDKANISRKTAEIVKSRLESLGAEIKVVENEIPNCNPMILGKIIKDTSKPTYLFYSHYDVQPASKQDGWDTEPFELLEKDGYLYGRGTSDDKGPIVATYYAVKDLIGLNKLNVNVGFIYEGEEESGSAGFEETLSKNKNFFGDHIGGILIVDTAWFEDSTPSMDYGFRGLSYLGIEIQGPYRDQHSGFGGSMREPMTDLVHLMSKLIEGEKVLIDGFYDSVRILTKEEEKLYNNITFNVDEFKKSLGLDSLPIEDPIKIMMNLWRYPTLSIHGIEGAFHGQGTKTVIPGKVTGKVSMRLVPDQEPKKIFDLCKSFIKKEFDKLNSPNKLTVQDLAFGNWWIGDVTNHLYKAYKEALEEYWEMTPAFTRSGGTIPIISFMEKTFNAPAMGVSVGQSSDGAHSQNERLRVKNLAGAKEVLKKILLKL